MEQVVAFVQSFANTRVDKQTIEQIIKQNAETLQKDGICLILLKNVSDTTSPQLVQRYPSITIDLTSLVVHQIIYVFTLNREHYQLGNLESFSQESILVTQQAIISSDEFTMPQSLELLSKLFVLNSYGQAQSKLRLAIEQSLFLQPQFYGQLLKHTDTAKLKEFQAHSAKLADYTGQARQDTFLKLFEEEQHEDQAVSMLGKEMRLSQQQRENIVPLSQFLNHLLWWLLQYCNKIQRRLSQIDPGIRSFFGTIFEYYYLYLQCNQALQLVRANDYLQLFQLVQSNVNNMISLTQLPIVLAPKQQLVVNMLGVNRRKLEAKLSQLHQRARRISEEMQTLLLYDAHCAPMVKRELLVGRLTRNGPEWVVRSDQVQQVLQQAQFMVNRQITDFIDAFNERVRPHLTHQQVSIAYQQIFHDYSKYFKTLNETFAIVLMLLHKTYLVQQQVAQAQIELATQINIYCRQISYVEILLLISQLDFPNMGESVNVLHLDRLQLQGISSYQQLVLDQLGFHPQFIQIKKYVRISTLLALAFVQSGGFLHDLQQAIKEKCQAIKASKGLTITRPLQHQLLQNENHILIITKLLQYASLVQRTVGVQHHPVDHTSKIIQHFDEYFSAYRVFAYNNQSAFMVARPHHNCVRDATAARGGPAPQGGQIGAYLVFYKNICRNEQITAFVEAARRTCGAQLGLDGQPEGGESSVREVLRQLCYYAPLARQLGDRTTDQRLTAAAGRLVTDVSEQCRRCESALNSLALKAPAALLECQEAAVGPPQCEWLGAAYLAVVDAMTPVEAVFSDAELLRAKAGELGLATAKVTALVGRATQLRASALQVVGGHVAAWARRYAPGRAAERSRLPLLVVKRQPATLALHQRQSLLRQASSASIVGRLSAGGWRLSVDKNSFHASFFFDERRSSATQHLSTIHEDTQKQALPRQVGHGALWAAVSTADLQLQSDDESTRLNGSNSSTCFVGPTFHKSEVDEAIQRVADIYNIREPGEKVQTLHQLLVYLRRLDIVVNCDSQYVQAVRQLVALSDVGIINGQQYGIDDATRLFVQRADQIRAIISACISYRSQILDQLLCYQLLQYIFVMDFLYYEQRLQQLETSLGWNSLHAITYLNQLQDNYCDLLTNVNDAVQHYIQVNRDFVQNTGISRRELIQQFAPDILSAHKTLTMRALQTILEEGILRRTKDIYRYYQQIIEITALIERFSSNCKVGFLMLYNFFDGQCINNVFPSLEKDYVAKILAEDDNKIRVFVKEQLQMKICSLLFDKVLQSIVFVIQSIVSQLNEGNRLEIIIVKYEPEQNKVRTQPCLQTLAISIYNMINTVVMDTLLSNELFRVMSDPIQPSVQSSEYNKFLWGLINLRLAPQMVALYNKFEHYYDRVRRAFGIIGDIIMDAIHQRTRQRENSLSLAKKKSLGKLEINQRKFNFRARISEDQTQQYVVVLREEEQFIQLFNRIDDLDSDVLRIEREKSGLEFISFKSGHDVSTAVIDRYRNYLCTNLVNQFHIFMKQLRMVIQAQQDFFQVNYDGRQGDMGELNVLIAEIGANDTNQAICREAEVLLEQICATTGQSVHRGKEELDAVKNELLQYHRQLEVLQANFNRGVFQQIANQARGQRAAYKIFVNQLIGCNPLLNAYAGVAQLHVGEQLRGQLGFIIYNHVSLDDAYRPLLSCRAAFSLKDGEHIELIGPKRYKISTQAQWEACTHARFAGFVDYLRHKDGVSVVQDGADTNTLFFLDFTGCVVKQDDLIDLDEHTAATVQQVMADQIGFTNVIFKKIEAMKENARALNKQIRFYGLFDLEIDDSQWADVHAQIRTHQIVLQLFLLLIKLVNDFLSADVATVYESHSIVQPYLDEYTELLQRCMASGTTAQKPGDVRAENKTQLFQAMRGAMLDLVCKLGPELDVEPFVQYASGVMISAGYYLEEQFGVLLKMGTQPDILAKVMSAKGVHANVGGLLRLLATNLIEFRQEEKQQVDVKYIAERYQQLHAEYVDGVEQQWAMLVQFDEQLKCYRPNAPLLFAVRAVADNVANQAGRLLAECNTAMYNTKISYLAVRARRAYRLAGGIHRLADRITLLLQVRTALYADINVLVGLVTTLEAGYRKHSVASDCQKHLASIAARHDRIHLTDHYGELINMAQTITTRPLDRTIAHCRVIYLKNYVFRHYYLDSVLPADARDTDEDTAQEAVEDNTRKAIKTLAEIDLAVLQQSHAIIACSEPEKDRQHANIEGVLQFHFEYDRASELGRLFNQLIERLLSDHSAIHEGYRAEFGTLHTAIQQLNQDVLDAILANNAWLPLQQPAPIADVQRKVRKVQEIVGLVGYCQRGKYLRKLAMITQKYLGIPVRLFYHGGGGTVTGLTDIYGRRLDLATPIMAQPNGNDISFPLVREILRCQLKETYFKKQLCYDTQLYTTQPNAVNLMCERLNIPHKQIVSVISGHDLIKFTQLLQQIHAVLPETYQELTSKQDPQRFMRTVKQLQYQLQFRLIIQRHARMMSARIYQRLCEQNSIPYSWHCEDGKSMYTALEKWYRQECFLAGIHLIKRLNMEYDDFTGNIDRIVAQVAAKTLDDVQQVKQYTQLSTLLRERQQFFLNDYRYKEHTKYIKKLQQAVEQRDPETQIAYDATLQEIEQMLQDNLMIHLVQLVLTTQVQTNYTLSCVHRLQDSDILSKTDRDILDDRSKQQGHDPMLYIKSTAARIQTQRTQIDYSLIGRYVDDVQKLTNLFDQDFCNNHIFYRAGNILAVNDTHDLDSTEFFQQQRTIQLYDVNLSVNDQHDQVLYAALDRDGQTIVQEVYLNGQSLNMISQQLYLERVFNRQFSQDSACAEAQYLIASELGMASKELAQYVYELIMQHQFGGVIQVQADIDLQVLHSIIQYLDRLFKVRQVDYSLENGKLYLNKTICLCHAGPGDRVTLQHDDHQLFSNSLCDFLNDYQYQQLLQQYKLFQQLQAGSILIEQPKCSANHDSAVCEFIQISSEEQLMLCLYLIQVMLLDSSRLLTDEEILQSIVPRLGVRGVRPSVMQDIALYTLMYGQRGHLDSSLSATALLQQVLQENMFTAFLSYQQLHVDLVTFYFNYEGMIAYRELHASYMAVHDIAVRYNMQVQILQYDFDNIMTIQSLMRDITNPCVVLLLNVDAECIPDQQEVLNIINVFCSKQKIRLYCAVVTTQHKYQFNYRETAQFYRALLQNYVMSCDNCVVSKQLNSDRDFQNKYFKLLTIEIEKICSRQQIFQVYMNVLLRMVGGKQYQNTKLHARHPQLQRLNVLSRYLLLCVYITNYLIAQLYELPDFSLPQSSYCQILVYTHQLPQQVNLDVFCFNDVERIRSRSFAELVSLVQNLCQDDILAQVFCDQDFATNRRNSMYNQILINRHFGCFLSRFCDKASPQSFRHDASAVEEMFNSCRVHILQLDLTNKNCEYQHEQYEMLRQLMMSNQANGMAEWLYVLLVQYGDRFEYQPNNILYQLLSKYFYHKKYGPNKYLGLDSRLRQVDGIGEAQAKIYNSSINCTFAHRVTEQRRLCVGATDAEKAFDSRLAAVLGTDSNIFAPVKYVLLRMDFDTDFLLARYKNMQDDSMSTLRIYRDYYSRHGQRLAEQIANAEELAAQLQAATDKIQCQNQQYEALNASFVDQQADIKEKAQNHQSRYDRLKERIDHVSQERRRIKVLNDAAVSQMAYLNDQFRQLTISIVSIFRHAQNPPELMMRLTDCLCILFNIPVGAVRLQYMQLTVPYVTDELNERTTINDLLFIESTQVKEACYIDSLANDFISHVNSSRAASQGAEERQFLALVAPDAVFQHCRCRKHACYERMRRQLAAYMAPELCAAGKLEDDLDSFISQPLHKFRLAEPGCNHNRFLTAHRPDLAKSLLQNGCLLGDTTGYNALGLTGHAFAAYNLYEYSAVVHKAYVLKAQFWRTVFRNDHDRAFNTQTIERLNDEADEPQPQNNYNALSLIFYQPENSFVGVRRYLNNFFFTQLIEFYNPYSMTDEQLELLLPYLLSPDMNTFTSSQTSVLATSMINWLNVVVSIKKESSQLISITKRGVFLQDTLQQLQSEMDQTVISINSMQDELQRLSQDYNQRITQMAVNREQHQRDNISIQNKRCVLDNLRLEQRDNDIWGKYLDGRSANSMLDNIVKLAIHGQVNPKQVVEAIQTHAVQYSPDLKGFVPTRLINLTTQYDNYRTYHDNGTLVQFVLNQPEIWKACGIDDKQVNKFIIAVDSYKIPIVYDQRLDFELVFIYLQQILNQQVLVFQQLNNCTKLALQQIEFSDNIGVYKGIASYIADYNTPILAVVFTDGHEIQEYLDKLEDSILTHQKNCRLNNKIVLVSRSQFTVQSNLFIRFDSEELLSHEFKFEALLPRGDFHDSYIKLVTLTIGSFWDYQFCQEYFYKNSTDSQIEQVLIESRTEFIVQQSKLQQLDSQFDKRMHQYEIINNCYDVYHQIRMSDGIERHQLFQLFDLVVGQYQALEKKTKLQIEDIQKVTYMVCQELLYDVPAKEYAKYIVKTQLNEHEQRAIRRFLGAHFREFQPSFSDLTEQPLYEQQLASALDASKIPNDIQMHLRKSLQYMAHLDAGIAKAMNGGVQRFYLYCCALAHALSDCGDPQSVDEMIQRGIEQQYIREVDPLVLAIPEELARCYTLGSCRPDIAGQLLNIFVLFQTSLFNNAAASLVQMKTHLPFTKIYDYKQVKANTFAQVYHERLEMPLAYKLQAQRSTGTTVPWLLYCGGTHGTQYTVRVTTQQKRFCELFTGSGSLLRIETTPLLQLDHNTVEGRAEAAPVLELGRGGATGGSGCIVVLEDGQGQGLLNTVLALDGNACGLLLDEVLRFQTGATQGLYYSAVLLIVVFAASRGRPGPEFVNEIIVDVSRRLAQLPGVCSPEEAARRIVGALQHHNPEGGLLEIQRRHIVAGGLKIASGQTGKSLVLSLLCSLAQLEADTQITAILEGDGWQTEPPLVSR